MYTVQNFRTKKAVREAVASGEQVRVYQPGPFPAATEGMVSLEGPHGFHTWYASATIRDGIIVKIK